MKTHYTSFFNLSFYKPRFLFVAEMGSIADINLINDVDSMAEELAVESFDRYGKIEIDQYYRLFNENGVVNEKEISRAIEMVRGEVVGSLIKNQDRYARILDNAKHSAKIEVTSDLRMIIKDRALDSTKAVWNEIEQTTDPLTGVPTRRMFDERIGHEVDRSDRNGPLSMLIIDLDHFKMVNDDYGHMVGDEVLRETGKRLKRVMRDSDFVARYGGEEFIFLLTNTSAEGACMGAHRILEAIKSEPYLIMDQGTKKKIPISTSVGVSIFRGIKEDPSGEGMLKEADSGLYILKGEVPDFEGMKRDRRGMVAFEGRIVSREEADEKYRQSMNEVKN